ncbi:MAG: hypothetical protein D3923_19110, partial [Candidatus Electrothrix sp. AR3]|nr:hypothetical protein [Candidatus Electrothrix sp. AR3]
MKLLLDTHIFLWLNSEPEKIPPAVYDACCDSSNQLYLSHVSPWEIQIKQQLGKLQLRAALSGNGGQTTIRSQSSLFFGRPA